ncbi:hypothetical protein F0562_007745 [Nyssa sinensis]|uniref:Cysteine-rich transmembrane domain-containing protein n=1 Tax=Nyssa sinensis TaxID=561372 RepID=A0A5J5A7H3_9ASTE|nr:hypothetical protein F0562_007746 [Nyssa sinensis]KAA8526155.1 hypothetical protein F0562_007745 [Nyssa sinensis]
MSQYDHNQPQVSYPPAGTGYSEGPYVAPPPAGYPMKDGHSDPHNPPPPAQTQSRGDGFWKGCCAALCCCCVLDACF